MKMAMMCISKDYRGRTDGSRRRPRMSQKLQRPSSYLMKESRSNKIFDYDPQQKREYMRKSFVNEDEGDSFLRQSMKGSAKKGQIRMMMNKKLFPEEGKAFNRMKTSYL